jgi:uncharacterized damage-inducible protein DinB
MVMMRKLQAALIRTLAVLSIAGAAGAQSDASLHRTPAGFGPEFLGQFNTSMSKFIALAEAMPAEKYAWSPGSGVMSVAKVYAHVAHYNYRYPSQNMAIALPAGVRLDTLEAVAAKAQVVALLRQSADYVRAAVKQTTDAQLAGQTRLYGRDVQRWAVLFQLLAHMNEHLGQSIAYARMNGVVPPWSG